MTAVCSFRARVDAHFAGGNSVADEVSLRRHLLDGCPDCRRRYTRQAMLAGLLPDGSCAEDRLAIALGLSARKRPRGRGGVLLLLAVLAAAAVLLGDRPAVRAGRPPIPPRASPAIAAQDCRVHRHPTAPTTTCPGVKLHTKVELP